MWIVSISTLAHINHQSCVFLDGSNHGIKCEYYTFHRELTSPISVCSVWFNTYFWAYKFKSSKWVGESDYKYQVYMYLYGPHFNCFNLCSVFCVVHSHVVLWFSKFSKTLLILRMQLEASLSSMCIFMYAATSISRFRTWCYCLNLHLVLFHVPVDRI